jgi:hypothetical protein
MEVQGRSGRGSEKKKNHFKIRQFIEQFTHTYIIIILNYFWRY